MRKTNVIIIGSGIASLQLARSLRDDLNVIVLTKSNVYKSNSNLAQGGIAAAIGKRDHPDKHYMDTLVAGSHHNDPEAVLELTNEAPFLIQELNKQGCPFDKNENGELLLGMEGAHSEYRIVHGGGDATGRTIIQFMTSNMNPNIEIIENFFVYELLMDESSNRCIGAKGKYSNGQIDYYFAEHIVIATGGCGQLYSYTSNAETVAGDGIALAYQAGAEITDMEFIQFHPTLLFTGKKAVGLVSEAVRGEGARLITKEGIPIMDGVHLLRDLAPRHIVSQTIYSFIEKGKQIFLDISEVDHFENRFPTITNLCERNGIDLKKGLIPVVPGSHFLMGGIKTDLDGRSSVKGLYAIGEAACTGVHGANRLASNSLLEGLFFGKRLAEIVNAQTITQPVDSTFSENIECYMNISRPLPSIKEIQASMMENAGIVRTKKGLMKQKAWLESFDIENWAEKKLDHLTTEEIVQVFMMITSWLITNSALERTESRGGHFRQDYPSENDHKWLRKQIIQCKKMIKDEKHEQIKAALAT
ncbi:L-aspartate oxidase [Cytobacillus massiliigabonensis]|uniref:L-aspartate oxidase n=1 Tax=Cytobacillus massiliigabonensis TaxID=1871011 RepID=UPI000C83D84B|nr:L-aspartate oxidase [Cytobacillus massiliigabonensis]